MRTRSSSAIPLLIIGVVLINLVLAYHTPAQTPIEAIEDRGSRPKPRFRDEIIKTFTDGLQLGTVTDKTGVSRTFDMVELGYDHPPFKSGVKILATGDIDGDARVDFIAGFDGQIQVLYGDGSVRFIRNSVTPTHINALGVRADGDVVDDFGLARRVPAGGASVIATFGPASDGPPDGPGMLAVLSPDGEGELSVKQTLVVGGMPSAVAFGDFDRDGNRDMAVTYRDSNTFSILRGDIDGFFSPPGVIFSTGADPVDIVSADINSDGKLDLIVANQRSNSVSVFQGTGDGEFFQTLSLPTGPRPVSVAIQDVNDDGKLDLVVEYEGSDGGLRAAEAESKTGGVAIFLNDAEPAVRPVIERVERSGKRLIVTGLNYAGGAKILVDGKQQKTLSDAQNPGTVLIGKKAAKKIKPDQTVVVQVESDGKLSEWFFFKRPD